MADETSTPKADPHATTSDEAAEDQLIGEAAERMHEMQGSMYEMMGACTKFMQAFIDMRLGYLKVMRAGLEDPSAAVSIMTKNMEDAAKAVREGSRKE